MTPTHFAALYGDAPPVEPAYAAVTVSFTDRNAAARLMETNGVPVQRRGERWSVGRAHTNGFVMELV